MIAALALPRALDRLPNRTVMFGGAGLMAATLITMGIGALAASGGLNRTHACLSREAGKAKFREVKTYENGIDFR